MDDAILHGKPFGIPLVYLDSSYIRVFFPGKIVKSTVLGMRFPEVFFLGGGGGEIFRIPKIIKHMKTTAF